MYLWYYCRAGKQHFLLPYSCSKSWWCHVSPRVTQRWFLCRVSEASSDARWNLTTLTPSRASLSPPAQLSPPSAPRYDCTVFIATSVCFPFLFFFFFFCMLTACPCCQHVTVYWITALLIYSHLILSRTVLSFSGISAKNIFSTSQQQPQFFSLNFCKNNNTSCISAPGLRLCSSARRSGLCVWHCCPLVEAPAHTFFFCPLLNK